MSFNTFLKKFQNILLLVFSVASDEAEFSFGVIKHCWANVTRPAYLFKNNTYT